MEFGINLKQMVTCKREIRFASHQYGFIKETANTILNGNRGDRFPSTLDEELTGEMVGERIKDRKEQYPLLPDRKQKRNSFSSSNRKKIDKEEICLTSIIERK
jgi:hypothetical protein